MRPTRSAAADTIIASSITLADASWPRVKARSQTRLMSRGTPRVAACSPASAASSNSTRRSRTGAGETMHHVADRLVGCQRFQPAPYNDPPLNGTKLPDDRRSGEQRGLADKNDLHPAIPARTNQPELHSGSRTSAGTFCASSMMMTADA